MSHELDPSWASLMLYGYAPGDYMGKCAECGEIVHDIDKRATCCRPCAEKLHEGQKKAIAWVVEGEDRYLRAQLARLQREYQAAAKPFIDRLVAIEMLRPPPPIFITKEQAEALGFLTEAAELPAWPGGDKGIAPR